MTLSKPLFLEKTDNDTFQVTHISGEIISEDKMPDQAISLARTKGYTGDITLSQTGTVMTNTPENILNAEQVIFDLSFRCNVRAVHIYDDKMNFKGYLLEARE